MSFLLAPELGYEFSDATDMDSFFGGQDSKLIRTKWEPREHAALGRPADFCKTNLFFGFFFDGTKNNYVQANATNNHSNVARLYDCYPGQSVPGVLPADTDWQHQPANFKHFFKVYVPGVASPFPKIGDSGKGWDGVTGGAAGRMGEQRIIWALAQAINNLHRYYFSVPLILDDDVKRMFGSIALNKSARAKMSRAWSVNGKPTSENAHMVGADDMARNYFELALRKLHAAVGKHWPDPATGRPAKVDPALVKTIYVSVFGFSRGATQARAFTNWFLALCELDAQLRNKPGPSLGGFAVEFNFLGVYDTVASVGLGNTLGGFMGHGAWADSEDSLRVRPGIECLHLVAAHELRRSFPLDSIAVNGRLSAGAREIVVPGVHSDIGCGYCPTEQGRGSDPKGDDMLARIPLLMMYKAARLHGVPLKLELANPPARLRFALGAEAITAFNAYIATCEHKQGPLHHIMREQARKQIEWRLHRRVTGKHPIEQSASFRKASSFEQNDLFSAAQEFEAEITKFLQWRKEQGRSFAPANQQPGFGNHHASEWLEIARWWDQLSAPPASVVAFFDNYVHDSRAWFKLFPGNPDSEDGAHKQLQGWVARRKLGQAQIASPMLIGKSDYRIVSDRLSPAQREAADEYASTGKIPRMITEGREPWESLFLWLAGSGYLRFRKIYSGGDTILLS